MVTVATCRQWAAVAGERVVEAADYATETVVRGVRWCARSEF